MSIAKAINIGIDLKKVNKARIKKNDKGEMWYNLRLINTPDSKYESDYMIVESLTKEERDSGMDSAILGNGRAFDPGQGKMAARQGEQPSAPPKPIGEDDLPF